MKENQFFPANPEKNEQKRYTFELQEKVDADTGDIAYFVVTPKSSDDWPIMEKVGKMYPIQDKTIFSVHEAYLSETLKEQAEKLLVRLNDPNVQKKLLKLANEYSMVSENFYDMEDDSSADALGAQAHMQQLKDQVKALIEGKN